ncbi:MAG: hypothetical protein HYX65_02390 [Gemmatimonadetes bacterium]|nr:hypothetical protein [Gemmatimonadota bacterium]
MSAVAGVAHPAAALGQSHGALVDSTVVTSPLPGGVAVVVRFLLNSIPTWLQITLFAVACVVGLLAVRWVWLRRARIAAWLGASELAMRWGLALAGVLVLATVGGAGAATWNYTQNDNDFCTGCHVMNQAFQRFSNAENKHGKLSCHNCHQQPLYASMRQLYLWVANRPREIGKHAKVPNEVCRTCHVTGDTAKWKRIAGTAGHRVHLESDSAVLKNLQCVTCHGVEVHQFRPVEKTCGQSNCHDARNTTVVLGKMETQTVRHCTSCHGFTEDVPALATRDSARGTLVPGKPQCLGCHEMQKVLKDFDEGRDPHGGKCGACHNPHTQKTPAAAAKSCARSGCHDDYREKPFHAGENHRKVASSCLTCHVPHRAGVDASECQGCHTRVRESGGPRPPVAFDTVKALRPAAPAPAATPRPPRGAGPAAGVAPREGRWHGPFLAADDDAGRAELPTGGDGPAAESLPEPARGTPRSPQGRAVAARPPPPSPTDSFPHARHAKRACLECHQTGSGHGRLTFERPRGCAICHHQSPTPDKCASCHHKEKYGAVRRVTVTVTVPGRPANARTVGFLHEKHVSKACTDCHVTPVTMAPAPTTVTCKDCHSDHHSARRDCSGCHKIPDPKAAHAPADVTHQRCDACHTATTIARLVPTRSFCATCHASKAQGHNDQRECTSCHFLAEPEAHKAKLVSRVPR